MSAPKKRFGQHFLRDPHWLAAIADVCVQTAGDGTIEIGPGQGALTAYLLERLGAIHAVEIDRDLLEGLKNRFGSDHLSLHAADALRVDYCALHPGPVRVVGNLPYNISTPLIFHLLAHPCIVDMVFLLQKEVVARLAACANEPDYGRLSVMVQARCSVEPLFIIGPDAFFPPPKVESQLVRLTPTPGRFQVQDPVLFHDLVAAAFGQRRKMLRHSLRDWVSPSQWLESKIDPTRRPETMSLGEFGYLADVLATARAQDRQDST